MMMIKLVLKHKFLALYIVLINSFLFSPATASPLQETLNALHLGGEAQVVPPPTSLELAFSPDAGATDLILKAIRSAHKSIQVAAYSFTSRPIGAALVQAHNQGINVQIVMDHEEVKQRRHSLAPYLVASGVPLRVDIVHTLQHNKYMVIDGQTVETGSFNFTNAAEHQNAENILVLWNDPKLAASYADNWQNLWDKAEAYGGQ